MIRWTSFRTLSNAHIICRIQWYLSTILVAFLNQTELISEKVLHISLTKYSTLSRSDLSNFLKYLDKQYLVLLGRISKTTLFSGSVKIHWYFSLPVLPLNSSIESAVGSSFSEYETKSNILITVGNDRFTSLATLVKDASHLNLLITYATNLFVILWKRGRKEFFS